MLMIFAVFGNQNQALEYVNKQHANIKFTKEENKDGKSAFLDVLIHNSETLVMTVYHKPT